jgi:hypothetical protein
MFHVKSSLLPSAERRYVFTIEATPDSSNGPHNNNVCQSRWLRILESSLLNRLRNEFSLLLFAPRSMNCHSSNPAR